MSRRHSNPDQHVTVSETVTYRSDSHLGLNRISKRTIVDPVVGFQDIFVIDNASNVNNNSNNNTNNNNRNKRRW